MPKQTFLLTRLLCILLLLTMVGGRCLASSWIEENGDSVNLRAQFCKPVSEDHLRSMLGEAFDPSRMLTEDMAAAKRTDPSRLGHLTDDVEDRSAVEPYYQEDDPNSERDLDEIVDIDAGWQEDIKDEVVDIEEDEEKDLRSEASLFKKEHEIESALADSTDVDRLKLNKQAEATAGQLSSLLSYMKRRRRASSGDEQVPPEATDDILGKVNKKNDSLLPLRLFLSGKNKKLRRKLKKVYRKKAKKLAGKPLPWQCTLEEKWLRLKEGYFPTLLQEGKCTTDKCFYRLYDCNPQLYPVKILKRDPDYCNPLPSISLNTTYEQKWNIVRYFVTVGCTCGIKDQKTGQPRRRKT
ncbi:uncharacterized protein LOC112573868 isoform X2 [Pomacea canaliculata]|uniref:uncharacterized protein LOC112573868 isoform X2 n=1 Tax=Pomacea canaliculata TaxID=400727 RepID=UPI000D726A9F|nr:uncharacterized protein LOC112573868 isoform X2 [Pomacea canaliculata]